MHNSTDEATQDTGADLPAPRCRELLSRWRVDIRWRAYGVICFQADDTISNRELAAYIGVDTRALYVVLAQDQHFCHEIRWNQTLRRGEPWWRINQDLKAPPRPDLPRLVSEPRDLPRVAHDAGA